MDNQDIHIKEVHADEDIHGEIKSFLEGLLDYTNDSSIINDLKMDMTTDYFED